MTIDKLKFGGRTYIVSLEENLSEKIGASSEEEIFGCIDYAGSKILIEKNMSKDSIQEILTHEFLHALLDRKNMEVIYKNSTMQEVIENLVEYLGPRLHAFLIDNPDFQKNFLEICLKK